MHCGLPGMICGPLKTRKFMVKMPPLVIKQIGNKQLPNWNITTQGKMIFFQLTVITLRIHSNATQKTNQVNYKLAQYIPRPFQI